MLDLLGEVAVTIRDVELYLDRIVNYRGSWLRAGQYVLQWQVVERIRAAKLDGSWELLLYDREYRNLDIFYWERRVRLRLSLGIDRYVVHSAPQQSAEVGAVRARLRTVRAVHRGVAFADSHARKARTSGQLGVDPR
jgi:hypothetical protein